MLTHSNVLSETMKALKADASLVKMLDSKTVEKGIYHLRLPSTYRKPVVLVTILSNVPVLHADDTELLERVAMRVHVVTKDAKWGAIRKEVTKVMCGLGFRRTSENEVVDGDMYALAIDFVTQIGAE